MFATLVLQQNSQAAPADWSGEQWTLGWREDSLPSGLQISDAAKFLIFQNLLLEQTALWF